MTKNPIPYEKTKEENAVEELFCKEFEKLQNHPMSDENSEILIKLIILNQTGTKEKFDQMEKESKQFNQILILDDRLKMLGYKSDLFSKVFLSLFMETPGKIVMYAHYMAYKMKKHGLKELTIDNLCETIFPLGFPSDEDLHILWNKQKVHKEKSTDVGTDNLLDYPEANLSISYEK